MQFIDLKKQYQFLQERIKERMAIVFDHGIFIMGPEVTELENKLATYANTRHCVTVASGTDALQVAMMALGIEPGDEIITTPFTFFATAEVIRLVGAVPVFVDIDPRTYNINPKLIEQAITPKTKMILPVNLYGQCADYDVINAIASEYGLFVIEDAAQSFGATYKGRLSCGLGTIGCTSFFPAKPLGCYGDGGACFTNDDELADKMRKIRNHGQSSRYHHVTIGMNSRLDSLQAAILLTKLEVFVEETSLRQYVATSYNQLLQDIVAIPYIEPHNTSIYAQYTVLVEDRPRIQSLLQDQDIPTAVHYPVPLHKQPVFKDYYQERGDLRLSEQLADRVLSLPFHPYLTHDEITKIVQAFKMAMIGEEILD